jgi:hypothetical protein
MTNTIAPVAPAVSEYADVLMFGWRRNNLLRECGMVRRLIGDEPALIAAVNAELNERIRADRTANGLPYEGDGNYL